MSKVQSRQGKSMIERNPWREMFPAEAKGFIPNVMVEGRVIELLREGVNNEGELRERIAEDVARPKVDEALKSLRSLDLVRSVGDDELVFNEGAMVEE